VQGVCDGLEQGRCHRDVADRAPLIVNRQDALHRTIVARVLPYGAVSWSTLGDSQTPLGRRPPLVVERAPKDGHNSQLFLRARLPKM
jgi:hypothetical protein